MTSTYDFFISYANRADDPSWAEWIAQTLEGDGYSCRLQAWDFSVGSNFVSNMDEIIQKSHRLILVLSPDYVAGRPMVVAEWSAKFVDDADGKSELLIPIMVRPCEVKGLLGPRVYLNVVGMDEVEARNAVLDAVKPGRRKPPTSSFPG